VEVGPKMTATIDETCVDNTAVEAAVGVEPTSDNKWIDLECDEWWKLQPQQKQNVG